MRKTVFILIALCSFFPAAASVQSIVSAAGRSAGLPDGFSVSVAMEESTLNYAAISPGGGSRGVMQISKEFEAYLVSVYMPNWFTPFNVWLPSDNATLGCRYLSDLYKRFGSWENALMAYNWGPGNLSKALRGEIAIPEKVQGYADRIMNRWRAN